MTRSCKWLEMMETMKTDLELASVYVHIILCMCI